MKRLFRKPPAVFRDFKNDLPVTFMLVFALGVLSAAITGVYEAIAWAEDHGACKVSHVEHRHEDATISIEVTYDLNFNPTTHVVPVPSKDWNETICDQWEYADGNGPNAGWKRRAAYR